MVESPTRLGLTPGEVVDMTRRKSSPFHEEGFNAKKRESHCKEHNHRNECDNNGFHRIFDKFGANIRKFMQIFAEIHFYFVT